jgi:preprotein translocase subunit SecD
MGTTVKTRAIVVGAAVVVAVLLLLPTMFKDAFTDTKWLSKPIALGLDLSGGVHLVYQVQTKDAVKSRLGVTANAIRSDLRGEKIAVTRVRVNDRNQIELTLLSANRSEAAKQLVADKYRDVSFVDAPIDGGSVRLVYGVTPDQVAKIERESVTQAIETLRNRVDQFGVAEPVIQRIGLDRILLQMPGVSDINAVKRVVGSVAKLEFRLLPVGEAALTAVTMYDRQKNPIRVEDQPLMGGDAVDTAHVAVLDGQVEVMLNLTADGGRTFGRITSENVGRNMAIILDGVVYSSPVIRDRITGGRATISGGFTLEEARELAIVLKAGALPAPLTVMEERTVGPSLGKESIEKGIVAIIVGSLAVFVCMAVYYQKAGLVAIVALMLNVLLVVALLSAFGATLTLPGLAGLALTVGMAVDSNVIIFERIRDELRNGASRDAAVVGGFDKAYSAIFDSNLTTFLSALILYYFGTGPVRGFAVTLSIGVVTTVFCAVFASRLAFDVFKLSAAKKPLSI